MTPHRHWLRNYVPKRVPIKLADNKTVYSAGEDTVSWLRDYVPKCVPIKLADNKTVYSMGEGTVIFNPIIDGKPVAKIGFTRVLHVPDL